ncbi:MAG: serine hydrolase, partial [Acidimicrobiia bacterium]
MQLIAEGLLRLDTNATAILGPSTAGGKRSSGTRPQPDLTMRQLLAHTSGIPDYFEGKRVDGSTLYQQMIRA